MICQKTMVLIELSRIEIKTIGDYEGAIKRY